MSTRTYNFPGGCYWYDRASRSWVVQTLDAAGNQIGDADYVGTVEGRDSCIASRRTGPTFRKGQRVRYKLNNAWFGGRVKEDNGGPVVLVKLAADCPRDIPRADVLPE